MIVDTIEDGGTQDTMYPCNVLLGLGPFFLLLSNHHFSPKSQPPAVPGIWESMRLRWGGHLPSPRDYFSLYSSFRSKWVGGRGRGIIPLYSRGDRDRKGWERIGAEEWMGMSWKGARASIGPQIRSLSPQRNGPRPRGKEPQRLWDLVARWQLALALLAGFSNKRREKERDKSGGGTNPFHSHPHSLHILHAK
jgi:hypothetical protein